MVRWLDLASFDSPAHALRWFVCVSSVVVQLAAPAGALAQDGDAKRVDVTTELLIAYTSNPYHEQNRRLEDFDSKNDPGERYEDMEGPSDLFARPAIGFEWSRKVESKRRFQLSADVEYTAFARNALANYLRLEAGATYDLTRRDQLGLAFDVVPRRFKKNYYNDVGGNKVFDRAIYLQVAPALSYRRDWTRRWATELEYEVSLRRYDNPFAHRDSTTHTVVLLLARELSQQVTVKVGPEFALAHVPEHSEFNADVDRSHRDLGAIGEVELDLSHHWAAELDLEYKHKSYLSADPADDAHHDRGDDEVGVEAQLDKGLGHTWTVTAEIGFTRVVSDRSDTTIDADDYGYRELVVGLGGQATF
jgi:hypothetical protein